MSLKERVQDYNSRKDSEAYPLTMRMIQNIYKDNNIKYKKLIRRPFNTKLYDNFESIEMITMLKTMQDEVIKADEDERIILQLDESIFNA